MNEASHGPEPATGVNEMSLADSFVLGVLRGFRLLSAAGLSPEDKRDILGTTRGSLEFDVVTHALQTLWDEQFLGHYASGRNSGNEAYQVESHDDESWWLDGMNASTGYGGDWSWDCDDSWDWWGYENYAGIPEHDEDEDESPPKPEDEAALKDAQQAERVAEYLALEAPADLERSPKGHSGLASRPRFWPKLQRTLLHLPWTPSC